MDSYINGTGQLVGITAVVTLESAKLNSVIVLAFSAVMIVQGKGEDLVKLFVS